ncbi:hypothetical protein [Sphingobacterium sp. IITKGP-BTPF85]|uniref:hypothetical protein n=1 Tax=Sphingobacterium sp. IITKGP-BTPF85 TaxID=1338009 RepID=UPI000389F797|nr:hypothetical protein [Sphingobacterium sp. IITKGP-BTPF85]KKX49788.1 hypothetical protein L950_0213895 [Sphingobacterium sp. IITKGP-BTPF85]
MRSAERPNARVLREELDFVFQKSLLPHIGLFNSLADKPYADNKKIKQLIIVLSSSIEQLGLPVINRYKDALKDIPEFWMLGFVRDKDGANSAFTITKIERKRPTLGIILLPLKSVAYTVVDSEPAHEFDFCQSSIIQKQYFDNGAVVKKYVDDDTFLRIIKGSKPVNKKTGTYVKNIIDNHSGAIRFVEMETPLNLIGIAKNRADIFVQLKPVWGWELGAFDLLIHSCGYMVTGQDGILPVEYNSDRLRIAGFIAKNNFEYDTLDFNKY